VGLDLNKGPAGNAKKVGRVQAWWHTPIIPALERWRQEDREFKASFTID
jgi:hypothetical protein